MPTTTAFRPAGREVLAAIGHVAWTTLLVVGAPMALARFFGWPLPTAIPDWGTVTGTRIQLIDPIVILNLFVCLAWISWATVMVYVALDVIDAARGVGQRLHSVGPFGAIAAKLVGSVVLLIGLARPHAISAMPAPPTAIVQVFDTTTPPAHPTLHASPVHLPAQPATETATSTTPAAPVWVVERGDSLWSIAEDHLGSGFRWTEIRDLNRDRIANPDIIYSGWTLTLPADANLPTLTPPATAAPAAIPEAQIPVPVPVPAAPTPNLAPEASTPATAPPQEAEAAVTVPAATAEQSVEATITPTSTDPGTSTSVGNDDGVLPALVGFVPGISGATVLATGLLLGLRHRRRRTGRPVPRRLPTPVERTLVAAADVPLVRWVGQELALLGEQLAGRHVDSNPVAVEFSETTGIELLWDQPFPDAPAPWEAVPGAWAWRLLYDPDAPVPNPERPALIAGLVTFGRRDGRQFLVNLEALGSMSITGDPEAVANFVRSVAVELGSTDEVADTYIVATPDVAPITVAHHLPRLTIVEPHEALSRLSATASGATRSLEQVGTDSTFAYRIFDPPVIALDVTVVVTSDGDPNLTDRLVENALPHHGVAVLIIGEAHHAAAHLAIDADGQARLEPLGVTFDAVGLPVDTEVAVNGLLDDPAPDTEPFDSPGEATSTAGDSDVWPGPEATVLESLDGEGHPSVIDLTDDPTMTTVVPGESLPELRLLVKVLGAPTIVDGPPLGRRELATVVYVACASKPVRHEHIQDAIWGGEAISSKSVFNLIGATRAALGRWDGEAILTTATRPDSTLRLAEGVWTDLELLRRLVAKAHAVDSSAALPLLVQALELVEGPPFNADGYEWANTDQLVSEAETLIERAALAAADLALDAGNLDLARWAVMQGLRGLPGDEPLYRARMHIEDAAGNPTAIRRAYSELIAYLDDFDAEPSDDTLNLYGQLAPSGRT